MANPSPEPIYRVRFVNQDQVYQVYVRHIYQGEMYGFVVLEDFIFGEHTTLVVDPAEEKLKSEFGDVSATIVPMHAIIRIDVVEKRGKASVTKIDGNVTRFPSPIYTPGEPE
ncbi:DUF1820 family protein [Granulosicoccaceae sp. 1_MG-2023]|nr:DUF1820 family protein [Granulosicoccaceae sp. 1_MG-2023]